MKNTLAAPLLSLLALVVLTHVSTASAATSEGNLPMPPKFALDASPGEVLSGYPLGVLPTMAIYAHHGQPDHKITLPNGLQGWVYEVHGAGEVVRYGTKGGDESVVVEMHQGMPQMSYTLVFSAAGKVVDVLYDNPHGQPSASALRTQRSAEPKAQKLPGVEHGPHFAPGENRE